MMAGHGHVTPNKDGSVARCGGPRMCSICAMELAQKEASRRPQPRHVTETEGDDWVTWAEWQSRPVPGPEGKRAHSIEFDDGTVFDLYGGWRERCEVGHWRRIKDSRVDGTDWVEAAFA